MFKTIVWATDGSDAADKALPYAKMLAGGDEQALVVVHCEEFFVGRASAFPVLADEEELEAKIRRQVEHLRAEGLDVTFKLLSGRELHAAHMIADAAREVGADVIVVGTRGHGPVAGLLIGSVTQRLLHLAPCPVLAIPAGKHAAAETPEREAVGAAR